MKLFSPQQRTWCGGYGVMLVMVLITVCCWVHILRTYSSDHGLDFDGLSSHTGTQPVLMAVNSTFVANRANPLLTQDMVLLGVVSRPGQPSLALIQLGPGQQARWFQEGQVIRDGLRLDKVQAQAVTLSMHGQLSTLVLAHRSQ